MLIPGFWLGSWAWDSVADRLRADGHTVHALTMLGIAERAAEAKPEIDLPTEIADVLAYLRDVVLVGHSGAKMPVTGVLDAAPELIARAVYVDSGPMASGLGVIDFGPLRAAVAHPLQVRLADAGQQRRVLGGVERRRRQAPASTAPATRCRSRPRRSAARSALSRSSSAPA